MIQHPGQWKSFREWPPQNRKEVLAQTSPGARQASPLKYVPPLPYTPSVASWQKFLDFKASHTSTAVATSKPVALNWCRVSKHSFAQDDPRISEINLLLKFTYLQVQVSFWSEALVVRRLWQVCATYLVRVWPLLALVLYWQCSSSSS
jgi:hypothetical protein